MRQTAEAMSKQTQLKPRSERYLKAFSKSLADCSQMVRVPAILCCMSIADA